jgi:hypothetical protein
LYLLEDFLESTQNPYYRGSFTWGRPKQGHFWQPWKNADHVRIMAEHIASNAPDSDKAKGWKY